MIFIQDIYIYLYIYKVHKRTNMASLFIGMTHCGKGFIELAYLKIYMLPDTGEKPYIFTVCPHRPRVRCQTGLKQRLPKHSATGEKLHHTITFSIDSSCSDNNLSPSVLLTS